MSQARSKNPLSVCILITDIDSATGGVQNQTRRLLRELGRRGVRTYVCARNYHRRARNEVEDGVVIHRSPVMGRSVPALNSLLYIADGLSWLIRHRKQYDVIHCQQMFGPAMVGLLAKALLRKPVVVRVTSTGDLGEVHHIQRMPLAGLRLRQLRMVDRWVALTSDMKREIRSLGTPPQRVVIIPNSAILPKETAYGPGVRARYRASLGLAYPRIGLFTGRLSEEKRLDTLLNAWKLLQPNYPDAHLVILGEGGVFRSVESELHDLHKRLGMGDVVHFMGHVSNVYDYLLASDVFILPTRSEGMSNSLVEAMAAGTAVVTTDIPSNRDLVQDGVNGLLFEPGNVEALARCVARVFDAPELGEQLGRAARAKAEADLSIDSMTSRYLSLYSSLVAA